MFQTMYKPFEPIPVIKDKESLTVPDMSFTPREIISKFSRGEKVPLGFKGLFDSEDDRDHLGDYEPAIFEDDPTRDQDFDFGDYVEEKHALAERERQRRHAQKRKAALDAKRKASYEEANVQEPMKSATTSGAANQPPSGQSPSND